MSSKPIGKSLQEHIEAQFHKAFGSDLNFGYGNTEEEENKALADFVMKQIAYLPAIHHDKISMWIEGHFGGEKTMKFGNLYSALLFRGIPIDPILEEYTDEHGNHFSFADNDIAVIFAVPTSRISGTIQIPLPSAR